MTVAFVKGSDIAAFVNTIWEDSLLVARENSIGQSLVTVFSDASGTALRKNADWGTATIKSISDTDDLTSEAFSPTALSTLTPGEFGAQFFITDTRIETDPFGVRQEAALELGLAMAEKIDTDLLGNFNSLTGGTVGTSGSTISWNYFFAMMSRLQANHAPKPWSFVCSPYQWYALGKAVSIGATVTNVPSAQESANRNFFVQNVAGVDIYTSMNCETSSSDAYCAMFSRAAIALDIRRATRLEVERDASRRGYELNLSGVYAHGVWRPTWGIQGIFVSSAPDGTA